MGSDWWKRWGLVVNGRPKRVDHAADHAFADRHAEDGSGALDFVALAELGVFAENDSADGILFEAQREAGDAVRKAEQLAAMTCRGVEAGDAIAERGDGPTSSTWTLES